MNDTMVVELASRAIMLTARVSAPLLGVTLAVGLLVSLFQSVTQIQEVTLTFVPKLVAVGLVLVVGGHWMLAELVGFTRGLFEMIPALVQAS
jgi:flagellar biosynthetic protein FliQ